MLAVQQVSGTSSDTRTTVLGSDAVPLPNVCAAAARI
jgi:hypothetical protein